jgi:hypothetical protein
MHSHSELEVYVHLGEPFQHEAPEKSGVLQV